MKSTLLKGLTYFHPIAAPHAGSRNRLEYAENDPATGNNTAISPRACTTAYSIIPRLQYEMTSAAGPPTASAEPEPTKRPVPRGMIRLVNVDFEMRQFGTKGQR